MNVQSIGLKREEPCSMLRDQAQEYIYRIIYNIYFQTKIIFISYWFLNLRFCFFSLHASNPILSYPVVRFQRGTCWYLFSGSEALVGGTGEDHGSKVGAEATRLEDEITDDAAEAGDDGGHTAG
jgi:hypothetical protein